jgi:sugar phosphate isomerase/epimerase
MKIGIRAHDVAIDTVEVLAEKIGEQGFSACQLAIKKAIVDESGNPRELNEALASEIKKAFEKNKVTISLLGVYLNYATEDKQQLANHYELYKNHLRLAKQMGVKLLGTETGSILPDYGYTKRNFSEEVFHQWLKSLEKLVEWAEEEALNLAIEGVASHIVNTPKRMHETLKAIGSERLKVILDPVNYLTIDNIKKEEDIIYNCFDLFADKIEIIHAKDFILKDGKIIHEVPGR